MSDWISVEDTGEQWVSVLDLYKEEIWVALEDLDTGVRSVRHDFGLKGDIEVPHGYKVIAYQKITPPEPPHVHR